MLHLRQDVAHGVAGARMPGAQDAQQPQHLHNARLAWGPALHPPPYHLPFFA